MQVFVGRTIKSVYDVDDRGARWASQLVEDILSLWKRCETVSVKAACCAVMAEFSSSTGLNQPNVFQQLFHSACDSRAAVREAAVAALGSMVVCYSPLLSFQALV